MLHIPSTNLLLLAAKQEPYRKAYLLMKNIEEFSGKKTQENGPAGRKKDKTERVTGQGRKTREEVVKWNQKTALRFQTGGDVRHPQPPSGPEGVDTITHHTFTKQKQPQATSELVYREPDQPSKPDHAPNYHQPTRPRLKNS